MLRRELQATSRSKQLRTLCGLICFEAERTETRSADRPRVPDLVFDSAPVCSLSLSLSLSLYFSLFLSLSLYDSDNLGLIVSFLSVVMSIMSIKSS